MNKYRKYQMIQDYTDRRIKLIVESFKDYRKDLAYRASIWEDFNLEINFANAASVACLSWTKEPEYLITSYLAEYFNTVGAVTIESVHDLNGIYKKAYYAAILKQLNFDAQDIREAGYLGLIRSHAEYFLNRCVTTSFLNALVHNLTDKKLNVITWEDVQKEYKRMCE